MVPCTPPPLYCLTGGRLVWAISEVAPQQNFWVAVDPAEVGLTASGPWGVYACRMGDQPLERAPQNVVARVGELVLPDRKMDVHVCVSRKPGVLAGRRQDAVRAVREMKRSYRGSGVAVLERCHYGDPLSSGDLQAIASAAVRRRPRSGSVVVCDMEFDQGWWDERLVGEIAETPWVSALFYTQGSAPPWAVSWDTSRDGICPGVGLVEGSRLAEFPASQEPAVAGREPWRLALRGRPGVVAVGMANPTLPARIVEVLRLISVLRAASVPTDVATMSDYLEKKGRRPEALLRTERTLESAVQLLGSNLDSVPRLYRDRNGQWVHALPLDLDTPGGVEELEGYRWYPMMAGAVSKLLDGRL